MAHEASWPSPRVVDLEESETCAPVSDEGEAAQLSGQSRYLQMGTYRRKYKGASDCPGIVDD
jgi:hypothetical protein